MNLNLGLSFGSPMQNNFVQATAVCAFLLVLGQEPGAPDGNRSPTMPVQQARLKSRRDDLIVAPGKRSAARAYGRKLISSFFLSGLARRRHAKPERKKEIRWDGALPRAAASRLHRITAW